MISVASLGSNLGTGTMTSPATSGGTSSTQVRYSPRNSAIESQIRRAGEQNEAYLNEAKSLYEPYVNAGVSSLDEYMKLLLGGVDGLKDDQNFQSMRDLAERKVMGNRAVSGLLRSGATASALDDAELNFANTYYGNRLNQLLQGVNEGHYGVTGTSSILEKLGGNATDLASALANIQMQREGNQATIDAARAQAGATTSAADKTAKSNMAAGVVGAIISAISDRRAKTNLRLVGKSNNGLNIYLGRYTKESGLDDGKDHLFLIAQEVMDVVPEAVTVNEETGFLQVNYAKALEAE